MEHSNPRMVNCAPEALGEKSEDTMSQSQSQFSINQLELLIIEFDPRVTEQAMKQVTDQIIMNGNKNFYIYVVSNQQEDPWDLSIAAYYTKDLYQNAD